MICDRCRKTTSGFIGSMFNTQQICFDCKEIEQQHPDYERARLAELEQVRAGNYHFPGVGLPADLQPDTKGTP